MKRIIAYIKALPMWQKAAFTVVVLGFAFYLATRNADVTGFIPFAGKSTGKPFRAPVPGYSLGRNGYRASHKGWDIPAPLDTPIISGGDGVVQFIGSKPGKYNGMTSCGTYVQIWHPGQGVLVTYCHMSRTAPLSKGEKVAAGKLIGYIGSTGHSTGPHLHLTVWKRGKPVDPGDYFPKEG